jgi:pimeloyl-ACP methyl ester carboxylesterase
MAEQDSPIRWLRGRDGTGPLAVLVHGMEDGWGSWAPLAARLDPHWRIAALDLPWRAGNDYRWRRGARAADWVRTGLAILDEPVDVLVGHSFGASALLGVLADPTSPQPVAAVLAAPFFRPPDLPVTWRLFERSRGNFDQIIAEGLRVRMGTRLGRVDEDLRRCMVDKMADKIGPAGFLALFEEFVATGEVDLTAVRVPTLVLAGVSDPCLAGGRAQALARSMPSATVRVEPHYDHFCHVEQAAEIAGRIGAFVRQHRTALLAKETNV